MDSVQLLEADASWARAHTWTSGRRESMRASHIASTIPLPQVADLVGESMSAKWHMDLAEEIGEISNCLCFRRADAAWQRGS